MKKKVKIICTIGPSSFKKKVLKQLKNKKVDIFRINLSHTNIDQIKSRIIFLKKNKIKNICIDSEGAQIRTTQCKKKFFLKENKLIKVYNENRPSDNKNIYIYPKFNFNYIKKDTKIFIGFNDLTLKVKKRLEKEII